MRRRTGGVGGGDNTERRTNRRNFRDYAKGEGWRYAFWRLAATRASGVGDRVNARGVRAHRRRPRTAFYAPHRTKPRGGTPVEHLNLTLSPRAPPKLRYPATKRPVASRPFGSAQRWIGVVDGDSRRFCRILAFARSSAGFWQAMPCSRAISKLVRSGSTHVLNADADIPLRTVFAFGATNPVLGFEDSPFFLAVDFYARVLGSTLSVAQQVRDVCSFPGLPSFARFHAQSAERQCRKRKFQQT